MSLNKVQLVINSRLYTVVSDESVEYMEMLGEHINEKVEAIVSEGKHIFGERPIVLAALNICDEYYKLMASKTDVEAERISKLDADNTKLKGEITELKEKNKSLLEEIENLESGQVTMAETEAIATSLSLQQELNDANTQIKFLEGQIKLLEEKNEKMKRDCDRRVQDIIDAFETPKKK